MTALCGKAKGKHMNASNIGELEKLNAEAKEKWGGTEAYARFEEKNLSNEKLLALKEETNGILASFAALMKNGDPPESAKAQGLVKTLQKHITDNYYNCTKVILAGLGRMYVSDERFKSNIDKHAAGTAQYIGRAIEIYCK